MAQCSMIAIESFGGTKEKLNSGRDIMRLNWQMWSGGMSDQDVSMIIHEGQKAQKMPAYTFSGTDTKVRSSEISWLTGNVNVQNLVWTYVKSANDLAFKFQVENICELQYTEYHASQGGHYDWHTDTFWEEPGPKDRKLSVTVQLSDPSDYEGGSFEFNECQTPDVSSRMKGTVLVFPSYLRHRVLPVTRGTRKSLVAWFQGPRWQ